MAKIALEEGEREREKQLERERRGSVTVGIGGRNVKGPRGDGGAALAAMWRERGSRMALIIASQFIEMKVCIFFSYYYCASSCEILALITTRWICCRLGVYSRYTPPRPALHSILARTAISGGEDIPPSWSPRTGPGRI